jgi:hypothetical protein
LSTITKPAILDRTLRSRYVRQSPENGGNTRDDEVGACGCAICPVCQAGKRGAAPSPHSAFHPAFRRSPSTITAMALAGARMPDLSGFADPGSPHLGRLHGDGHCLTTLTDRDEWLPNAPATSPGVGERNRPAVPSAGQSLLSIWDLWDAQYGRGQK